jgi:DNA polymerase-3 subunit alpha
MKDTRDKRATSSIPFVGLHAHSVAGSIFDAIGYPPEHMDFAYQNGSDALALTDHGNMNGFSYQLLHWKKMKAEGKKFKAVFGVEAYFLPSLKEWREEYNKAKEDAKLARKLAKEEASGATVEDEGESKKAQEVLKRRRHLILLAQNQTGLNNIFKIISASYKAENYYRYPRVDYEMLEKYSEGVIAASACLGGVYAGNYWENREEGPEAILDAMRETTRQMIKIFGARWHGELQWNGIDEQHELNQYIIKMHEEFGIPLISTADSHYPNPDAWKDRELYTRLGWLGKGGLPEYISSELPIGVEDIGYELYPKNGDQVWESYKKYSDLNQQEYDDDVVLDSITRTHAIAHELIEDFEPNIEVKLPDFVVPKGATATGALTQLAIDGLRSKDLHKDQDYVDRLKMELKVISDRGFSKYFLTMKAIVDKANACQLTGPGRGSAAGSLAAYVLNITQIDPIKHGLLFERFLRRDATDYPDIDYDVAEPMELKEMLAEEWGHNTVVPISNWNTLQLRSLIKDISKFYEIPFIEANKVTGVMIREATPDAKRKNGIRAGVYNPTWEEVMEFSPSLRGFLLKYPQIKPHVEALVGQVRSCSRHAGGVLIADDLDKHMPLINSGGIRQAPWAEGQNVRHLEPLGFIKFDLLGLSTLRMIDGAVRHILRRHQGIENPSFEQVKQFYNENLHPDVIDFNNAEVYENIFHKGNWAGVFQFTEEKAQQFCQRATPQSLIDISAITSIYRPGPLAANVHEQYIAAKNDPEEVYYLNDMVKDVTEESYGFLIFQEQIALLAHKLGKDLSLDEGNLLRKVLTKRGTGKGAQTKEKLYTKFIAGCVEKGINKFKAEDLWKTFEYFSGYGFNKSHAVSYSAISFQCAWLLNYYPSEWMAAFLDKEPEARKEKAINIAKSYGFAIRKADVNNSGDVWEISDDDPMMLIQPLSSIKGLGDKAIEQILMHRPFETIEEFIFNDEIVYSKLNKKALDVLIRSGTADCLMDERFTGRKHFWSAVAVERPASKKKLKEQIELYQEEGDFTEEEEIENTISLTGIFPMDLVIDETVRSRLDELYVPPVSEYDPDLGLVWFIPREIVQRNTKNGKPYWIVSVIDSNSALTKIRCWGVNPARDKIFINRPYMARLDYSEEWGFSARAIRRTMKLLG